MTLFYILIALALVVIAVLVFYAIRTVLALQKQKSTIETAQKARKQRILESITIIAKAMQSKECNHSEGVIRLKMLLEPLGKRLANYAAMYELYLVVMDMPTHEERRALEKRERRSQDKIRESAETKLENKIMLELRQLLADVESF